MRDLLSFCNLLHSLRAFNLVVEYAQYIREVYMDAGAQLSL